MHIDKATVDAALYMANQLGLKGKTVLRVAYAFKPLIEGTGYLSAMTRVATNDHIYFELSKEHKEKEDDGKSNSRGQDSLFCGP